MQTFQKSLYQILVESNEQLYCPPIQREYVWDKKKREELLSDIEGLTLEEESHFFGTLILSGAEDMSLDVEGQVERYRRRMIIDGQQRLTSLYLLLLVAHQRMTSLAARTLNTVKGQVSQCVVTAYDEVHKLVPTIADQAELESVIKGDFTGRREITRAASQFRRELDGLQSTEDLRRYIDAMLHRTTFVVVELTKGEDPCSFFAAANGRGIPLSPTDLIKNLLLMKSGEKNLQAASNQYWLPLESALGAAKLRQLTLMVHDVTFGWGKRSLVYKQLGDDLKTRGAEPFFRDLSMWKDAFLWLEREQYKIAGLPQRTASLAERAHRCSKFLPDGVRFILLLPIHEWLQGKLTAAELSTCFEYAENYSIRMFGGYGTALRDVSARLAGIRKSSVQGAEFVSAFSKALFGHEAYRRRNDEEFQRFARELRARKAADENWVKACLLGWEAALRPASTPLQPSLEHILPKKWISSPLWSKQFDRADDGDIQFRLGNLTILSLPDNSDVGRASFEEKKMMMARSPLLINEKIIAQEAWSKDAILARADEMLHQFCEIWPQRGVEQ